jgi:DNA-binding transcriptional LysR family regulator
MLGEEFGSVVFAKLGKRLTLTETGTALWNAARRIERDLADVRRQVAELNNLEHGLVRVGAGTHIINFFLQPVLKRFHAKHPRIDVRIVDGPADSLSQQLRDGGVDLAIFITYGQPTNIDDPMTREFLYEEEFVWAVQKDHPLAGRHCVPYRELITFPLIIPSPRHNLTKLLRGVLETAGPPPKISMELDSEESIEKVIGIRNSVGLLSKHRAVRDRVAHFRIVGRPLLARFELVRPTQYTPRAVKEFVEMCRHQAAVLAGDDQIRRTSSVSALP